jgi:aminoglycoside phosphotransferase (APT) family kinase protein
VATGAVRDDEALTTGLESWLGASFPDRPDPRVDALVRPKSGWSNETVIIEWSWAGRSARSSERLVVRLPLVVPSYPSYELRQQARVLDALSAGHVPAPRAVAVEDDECWLGTPFLVMSFVEGRPVGEAPALDKWLLGLPLAAQRRVQEGFLESLARAHTVDWTALTTGGDALRVGIAAEVTYWTHYVDWAADGAPARVLADALAWCAEAAPPVDVPMSLLWGDPRLGNVMYDDDGRVVALLDWELASIGPAEMDLAWYLVLDELVAGFVERTVPGFVDRDASIRFYERALGREVAHVAWHEIFALARSIAINDRQARLAAAAGTRYPGVAGEANPMLAILADRITAFSPATR